MARPAGKCHGVGLAQPPARQNTLHFAFPKKKPPKNTKITLLPLPSACLPISGALNELFGGSGPVFLSPGAAPCLPELLESCGNVLQCRKGSGRRGGKITGAGGNIFSLSVRLLAGFPARAAEPPAHPSPIRSGDRHPRGFSAAGAGILGSPVGLPR